MWCGLCDQFNLKLRDDPWFGNPPVCEKCYRGLQTRKQALEPTPDHRRAGPTKNGPRFGERRNLGKGY